MIRTAFSVGEWTVEAFLDIEDVSYVYDALKDIGCSDYRAREACEVLIHENTGYTYTSFFEKRTVMFASRASDPSQMYDTITHELKHIVEHISDYYGVNPKSEEAAYLQGEIGRLLFPSVVVAVCPSYKNT